MSQQNRTHLYEYFPGNFVWSQQVNAMIDLANWGASSMGAQLGFSLLTSARWKSGETAVAMAVHPASGRRGSRIRSDPVESARVMSAARMLSSARSAKTTLCFAASIG